MPDHANAQLVRTALTALQEGDLARFAEAFTADAVWHVPGVSPLAGDYPGRTAILMLFARIAGIADGSYRFELLDVMASDDHAVHWQRVHATRGRRRLDLDETILSRIVDGRIAEVWQFTDLYAHDGFFKGLPARHRRRRDHPGVGAQRPLVVEPGHRRAVSIGDIAHPTSKRSPKHLAVAAGGLLGLGLTDR